MRKTKMLIFGVALTCAARSRPWRTPPRPGTRAENEGRAPRLRGPSPRSRVSRA